MKCAECGRENLDDAKFCSYCACPLVKEPEITDTGSALRKIYNDFGYEKVFGDHRYITSALNDFVPDSEMLANNIEMVYRAGLGKVYITQVGKGGKPDKAFYNQVKRIIVDDSGLSEKRADQLIRYFDEMLGWETHDSHESTPVSESIVKDEVKKAPVKPVKPASQTSDKTIKSETEPDMSVPMHEAFAALAAEANASRSGVKVESEKAPKKPVEFNEQDANDVLEAELEPEKSLKRIISKIIIIVATVLFIGVVSVAVLTSGKNKNNDTITTKTTMETTVENTTESTTTQDPSAPIGYFVFSDDIGFRTWWDVFYYVYGIELDSDSDPRIKTIIEYNGADPSTYSPQSGDKILLPPLGVIAGTIPNTYKPG